jgi:tetratricopeptide (TPR) repeat protein
MSQPDFTLMTSNNINFQKILSNNINMVVPECTNSLIQIEMISRLNNLGCVCLDGETSDLSQAGNYFRRALAKVNELLLFNEPFATIESNKLNNTFAEQELAVSNANNSLYVYQRGEYDEGMHGYSEPIPFHPDMVSTKNAAATIVFNLGQLYLRLNNNEEAKHSFLRALQLGQWGSDCLRKPFSTSTTTTGGVSLLAVLHNIGHVQYRSGNYEDAIKTYSHALDVLKGQHQYHYNDSNGSLLELADTLNCLGVCHFHLPQPDTQKALSFYHEALALRRAVLGQDAQTKEIATYINNCGRVFYLTGEHNAALEHYKVALSIRRALYGDDHLDVAACMYNLGQTHHNRRELDQAMALYQQFLAIAKKRLGYFHRDVCTMLKCMAQIKHESQQPQEASALYREAIQVGRAAMGEYHPEIASM